VFHGRQTNCTLLHVTLLKSFRRKKKLKKLCLQSTEKARKITFALACIRQSPACTAASTQEPCGTVGIFRGKEWREIKQHAHYFLYD